MDNAVALVQTYLRLNGFFTVTEYQVQDPIPGREGAYETATDLDIIAVRLPWAAESVRPATGGRPRHAEVILAEDPLLNLAGDRIDLIIGEVNEGAGQLNRRLRTPEVLHAAVRRAGCCPEEHFEMVVADLAARGQASISPAEGMACRIRLASFCGIPSPQVEQPPLLVVTLAHIITFIRDRLHTYAPILQSAAFRDPVLDLLKLFGKIGMELRVPR